VKRPVARFGILAGMLLGLPLLGVILAGRPLSRYMEFPPQMRYIDHAPFSWPVFVGYLLLILAAVLPLAIRAMRRVRKIHVQLLTVYPLPWWGWLGLAGGLVFWFLAWTRFPWFASLQAHTFIPLWVSYIVVINAMTYRRTGTCMMRDRPGFFLALFPFSALFWWFFEYLNRFVQNWHYTGVQFDPWTYFWCATLSFSTVLPAVLGTMEWLTSSRLIQQGFRDLVRVRLPCPKAIAAGVLSLSAAGLAGVGVWPDILFPVLWVSPLLIIVSFQILGQKPGILDPLTRGDWRPFAAAACAGLMCGWFWEMWNYYSLAKWTYSVPYVQKYLIFEMPVVGFAGYLPFGLECAVMGDVISRVSRSSNCLRTI